MSPPRKNFTVFPLLLFCLRPELRASLQLFPVARLARPRSQERGLKYVPPSIGLGDSAVCEVGFSFLSVAVKIPQETQEGGGEVGRRDLENCKINLSAPRVPPDETWRADQGQVSAVHRNSLLVALSQSSWSPPSSAIIHEPSLRRGRIKPPSGLIKPGGWLTSGRVYRVGVFFKPVGVFTLCILSTTKPRAPPPLLCAPVS